jgi:hypothetical protein
MKLKEAHLNGLIVFLSAILIGGIGIEIAFLLFVNHDYDIPWNHFMLPTPPEGSMSIAHVAFYHTFDDPVNDIISIQTEDGTIYSNTLFEKEWSLVEGTPNFDEEYTSDCAPTWAGAKSDAQIWAPPPTGNDVRDSAGARFEHASAIAVRCYVLYKDGTLEAWTRADSAQSAGIYTFLIFTPVFGIAGAIIGVLIGVFINRYRERKTALAQN